MKIAAYVAGDANIVFPSVVCLKSLKKHNNFDLFIFTNLKEISSHQRDLLAKYDITAVDVDITKLKCFSAFGRWPLEVFSNYSAPDYLYERGYDYAIKLDYDILVLGKYEIESILPNSDEIMTILQKRKLISYVSDLSDMSSVLALYPDMLESKAISAGVFLVNLSSYSENRFFEKFQTLFGFLHNVKLKDEFLEQFVLAAMQGLLGKHYKVLPENYNWRAGRYGASFYYQANNDIINLHYTCKIKPWSKIDDVSLLVNKSHFLSVFPCFNLWISFANQFEFRDWEYQRRLYSESEIIFFEKIYSHHKVLSGICRKKQLASLVIRKVFKNCINSSSLYLYFEDHLNISVSLSWTEVGTTFSFVLNNFSFDAQSKVLASAIPVYKRYLIGSVCILCDNSVLRIVSYVPNDLRTISKFLNSLILFVAASCLN